MPRVGPNDRSGVPVDPQGETNVPARRGEVARARWNVLAAVSLGGVVGALGRYGLFTAWPSHPGTFPWATFVTNVTGCLLIGVLMVLVSEVWAAPRLVRAFLGTGVLGGYTTFSSYTVELQGLVASGAARTALLYLAGTLACAAAAVYAGIVLTRLATGARPSRRGRMRRRGTDEN